MSAAISLPFSFNTAGQLAYTTDEKKIIQDRIVLALMTKLGERVMRPDFGSNIYDSLFQNESFAEGTVNSAANYVFSTFFPNLKLNGVVVTSAEDGMLEFEIRYRKGANAEEQALSIKSGLFSRAGELIEEASRGRQ